MVRNIELAIVHDIAVGFQKRDSSGHWGNWLKNGFNHLKKKRIIYIYVFSATLKYSWVLRFSSVLKESCRKPDVYIFGIN